MFSQPLGEMWKAVMTLIALILVLIVVRPPENVKSVPVSRPQPIFDRPVPMEWKSQAYFTHIGNRWYDERDGKRRAYEV